jgi:hypothetical protein
LWSKVSLHVINCKKYLSLDNTREKILFNRFTQLNDKWVYDKSENLSSLELTSDRFTHLFVEENGEASTLELLEELKKSHEIVQEISAFGGLEINYKQFPGIGIRKKKALSIFKRKL